MLTQTLRKYNGINFLCVHRQVLKHSSKIVIMVFILSRINCHKWIFLKFGSSKDFDLMKRLVITSGWSGGTSGRNSAPKEGDSFPSWRICWTWNYLIMRNLQIFTRSFWCSNSSFREVWFFVQPVDNLVHLSNIFCWFLSIHLCLRVLIFSCGLHIKCVTFNSSLWWHLISVLLIFTGCIF